MPKHDPGQAAEQPNCSIGSDNMGNKSQNINIRKLTEKDEENLVNLKVISRYLSQTIDEHQKILNTHFDLKDLYTKELEQLAKVASIKRFSIKRCRN